MKKTKIIYINAYICYERPLSELALDDKWFYLFGMGHILAEKLIKKRDDILVENWRPDHSVTTRKEKMIDGIMCRVFSAREFGQFGDFSRDLLCELKSQALQFKVVVHFMGAHRVFYNYIAWRMKGLAMVATHLGGGNPEWRFKKSRNLRNWLYWQLERKVFLKHYGCVFCQTDTERDYLESILGKDKVNKTAIFGVDFNIFKPMGKVEARKKLGLPLDKKIILQVGRAVKPRGVDLVLSVWQKIQNPKLFLYMVDIHPDDELYDQVRNFCGNFCGKVNFIDLPFYYNAADLLIYLPYDDESLNFAGTSYVPLEAMACGTPVVATTLIHFPDAEIKTTCRVPRNESDVAPMVLDLLANPASSEQCRALRKKIF